MQTENNEIAQARSIWWQPQGNLLASAGVDGTIHLGEADTGQLLDFFQAIITPGTVIT